MFTGAWRILVVSGIVAKETVEVAGLTVANQTFGKLHFTLPFVLA